MPATTFRSDLVAALKTVLDAQVTATPTQLRAVYRARPGAFSELPCAYVGSRDERITYTAGQRTRTFAGLSVVLVDTFTDGTEVSDRMDDLVDLLVDRFTTNYAAVAGGGSITQLSSVTDTELELAGPSGPVVYRAAILGFDGTFVGEGRT